MTEAKVDTPTLHVESVMWLSDNDALALFDIEEHAKLGAEAKLHSWMTVHAPAGATWCGAAVIWVDGPHEQIIEDDDGNPTGEVLHWKRAVAERPFIIDPAEAEKIEALRAEARARIAAALDVPVELLGEVKP